MVKRELDLDFDKLRKGFEAASLSMREFSRVMKESTKNWLGQETEEERIVNKSW